LFLQGFIFQYSASSKATSLLPIISISSTSYSSRKADNEKTVLLNWLKRFGSRFRTGFVVLDPNSGDNTVIFANKFYIEMTGYNASEIIGSNLGFLHGEDTDMVQIREVAQEIMGGVHYHTDFSTPEISRMSTFAIADFTTLLISSMVFIIFILRLLMLLII